MATPVGDVEVELRKVLKQDLDFKGEFAFGRAFPDAPNPCLTLDGIGLVGLPLSPEGAKAVVGQCVEAPFGKGERTVVDKHVRDTWEMDASKVKFRNPAWNAFVNRLVGEVCTALAVNVAASQPRAELYKLLVYEKGSHFLPHVDTEKANGMFASIIIVLPSEFTGGDVHTSHSGVHSTFNSSKGSLTQTTVLAWYTDVKHEVKPITGGYRFALSYNLMHTTTALRPALSSATGAMQKLRSIFQAWNANESASDRIYYLLDHDYSMANLSASALKGKDAHIIAVLDTLAKEIGFGLGLACMEMTETGSGDGDGGGYSYGRRRKWGYGYEEEDEDDEDVDFVEDPERTASIECFVDPDGNPIEDDDLQADDSLHEELKSKGHYNQEYEGYMGNYAGTLERFYRSSILIIWPRWSNIGGGNADRRATGSFERLESCDSDSPTAEDRSDFEYLCEVVRFMDDTQDDAIEILFDTAVRWCDVHLWSKAVAAVCGGVGLDAFGLEHLRAGYEAFGFDSIADTLRPIIIASTSNGRLQFTKNLCDLQECDAAQLNAFVDELRTEILANLRPYSSADELQAFATEVMTDGGAPRLRDLLLPQIQKLSSTKNANMLDAFLDWLHGTFSASPSSDVQEIAARREIIKSLLDMLVSFKELFASTTTQTRAHQWAQPVNTIRGDPNVAISLINKCLQYENAPLALSLLEKMVNQALRTATKLGTVEAPATLSAASTNVILEIVVAVIPGVKPLFEAKGMDVGPQLARMAEAAVTVKLAVLKAKAAGAVVSREELANLLDFTKGLSNANALLGLIIEGLKSLPWNETTWTLCLEEFHSRRASNEAIFGPHVLEMSKMYARKASVQASSYYGVASTSANATKVMKLCYLTGGPESFVIVLSRILEPKNENYITNVLVPLIPELKALATTHNAPLTRAPFSEAIQRIVAVWMAVVLGPQPNMATVQDFASRISRWTCTCAPCTTLVQFLRAADKDTVQLYRIGAPKVNHVRSEVSTKIPAAYLTLETVRTSPQTLNVKKAPEIARAGKWGSLIAQGRKVLASIGNDALLRSMWGPAYATALGPLLTQEQRAVPVRVQPAPAPVAAPKVPAKRKADTRDVIEIDSD